LRLPPKTRDLGVAPAALPSVIGHRGAAGVAPENTLGGFVRARALGCRWVEFDVRLTADGEPILLHDDRLCRTTNGHGAARRMPLAAIRRLDAGHWFAADFAGERVPTLAEAVTLLGTLGLGANIELKAAGSDEAATGRAGAAALARLWPPHLPAPLVSSFLPTALTAVAETAPSLVRGLLLHRVPKDWRRRAEDVGAVAIHADHRGLDPAIVAAIRENGYSVLAYTVNEPARARTLLTWGVTSVFSDLPHIISAALAADGSCTTAAGPAESSGQGTVR
jgi:glycerophosphoryl diester phosphodiesterase